MFLSLSLTFSFTFLLPVYSICFCSVQLLRLLHFIFSVLTLYFCSFSFYRYRYCMCICSLLSALVTMSASAPFHFTVLALCSRSCYTAMAIGVTRIFFRGGGAGGVDGRGCFWYLTYFFRMGVCVYFLYFSWRGGAALPPLLRLWPWLFLISSSLLSAFFHSPATVLYWYLHLLLLFPCPFCHLLLLYFVLFLICLLPCPYSHPSLFYDLLLLLLCFLTPLTPEPPHPPAPEKRMTENLHTHTPPGNILRMPLNPPPLEKILRTPLYRTVNFVFEVWIYL